MCYLSGQCLEFANYLTTKNYEVTEYLTLDLIFIFLIIRTNVKGKPLVEFCMKEGLLPNSQLCPVAKCNQPMHLYQNTAYPDGCHWYCGHMNKKNKRKCTKALSIRSGTWFSESRLSLVEIVSKTLYTCLCLSYL